jgi:hypothetical protein
VLTLRQVSRSSPEADLRHPRANATASSIDYFFHLSLEVVGVALALSFVSLMRSRTGKEPATAERGDAEVSPVGAER